MTPQDLVAAIAGLNSATILSMLAEATQQATNSQLRLRSLREHLVTAHWSEERIATEVGRLTAGMQAKQAAHDLAMSAMRATLDTYRLGSNVAKAEIAEARDEARAAQRQYDSMLLIAKAKNVIGAIAPDASLLQPIE